MKDDKTKHTLWLRAGDFEKLRDAYPDIGASAIIRRIVAKVVDSLETEETPKIDMTGINL